MMKKILSLLLSFLLLLSLSSAAFAEEQASLTWDDFGSVAGEVFGEEAHFVSIPEVNAKIWIPDYLEPVNLTEEDRANNTIAEFLSYDETEMVLITYSDAAGLTLPAFKQALENSDIHGDLVEINGIPMLQYYAAEGDSLVANFITTENNLLQLIFCPFSDDLSSFLYTVILSSIQPDTGEDIAEEEAVVPVNPVSGLISK